MPFNDALDWSADLGGGTTVSLVQAGSFRSDAGALFGPVPRVLWDRLTTDEIDHEHRLLQALNCLLIQTPAGRVLVETGIGERYNEKMRLARGVAGDAIVPAMRKAGFDPATVDVVAMSHLHFDHAGGLLLADGSRAFPRATIVAQRSRVDDRVRREQPDRGELRPAGAAARQVVGRGGCGRRRTRAAPRRFGDPHRRPLVRAPGRRGARHRHHAGVLRRPMHAHRGAPTRAGSPRSTISRWIPSRSRDRCSRVPPTRAGSWRCRTRRRTRSAASSATATGSATSRSESRLALAAYPPAACRRVLSADPSPPTHPWHPGRQVGPAQGPTCRLRRAVTPVPCGDAWGRWLLVVQEPAAE